MTDIEFVRHWVEHCTDFIDPKLFREARARGLVHIFNKLNGTQEERLVQALSRMANSGRYVGDEEIERIAGHIERAKFLRNRLTQTEITDPLEVLKVLDDLKTHMEFIRDYFKSTRIP